MKNDDSSYQDIPFGRLIYLVNQRKDKLLGESLEPFGITSAQFKVIALIALCYGKEINQLTTKTSLASKDENVRNQIYQTLAANKEIGTTSAELSQELSVDTGAMTRMIERLVCKNWVKRSPNPADKRSVLLSLTKDGLALYHNCHLELQGSFFHALTDNLTKNEIETLTCLLIKLLSTSQSKLKKS